MAYTDKDRLNYMLELRMQSELQFDKQIRYIASGAIGLSVTLFTTLDNLKFNCFLIVSWGLFVLTLFLNLGSYKTASKSVDYALLCDKKTKKYNNATKKLNLAATITLITGIIVFLLYIYLSLKN